MSTPVEQPFDPWPSPGNGEPGSISNPPSVEELGELDVASEQSDDTSKGQDASDRLPDASDLEDAPINWREWEDVALALLGLGC